MGDKRSRLVVVVVLAMGLVDDGYASFLRAAAEAGEGVGLPSRLVSSAPLRKGASPPVPAPALASAASVTRRTSVTSPPAVPARPQTDGFDLHANV